MIDAKRLAEIRAWAIGKSMRDSHSPDGDELLKLVAAYESVIDGPAPIEGLADAIARLEAEFQHEEISGYYIECATKVITAAHAYQEAAAELARVKGERLPEDATPEMLAAAFEGEVHTADVTSQIKRHNRMREYWKRMRRAALTPTAKEQT